MSKINLKQWIEETENNGQCVKFGFYRDGNYYDCGTIWDAKNQNPDIILKVAKDEFRFLEENEEYKFYADSSPVDEFGQTATFRKPSSCYWWYIDKNTNNAPAFLSKLNHQSIDALLKDPDQFTDWANWKYPNSFSYVGETMDSDISEWFWDCYTHNPRLTEQEVLDIMCEYFERH